MSNMACISQTSLFPFSRRRSTYLQPWKTRVVSWCVPCPQLQGSIHQHSTNKRLSLNRQSHFIDAKILRFANFLYFVYKHPLSHFNVTLFYVISSIIWFWNNKSESYLPCFISNHINNSFCEVNFLSIPNYIWYNCRQENTLVII